MITIKPYNNKFLDTVTNFGSIEHGAIKKFIGIKWDVKHRKWLLNINYVNMFLKDFCKYNISITKEAEEKIKIHNDWVWRINNIKKSNGKFINFEFSSHIPLYDYQKTGSVWLLNVKKGILAFSVGCGKTFTSIEAFNQISGSKCLVLCPSSLKKQWVEEIKKAFPYINVFPIYEDNFDTRVNIYNNFAFNESKSILLVNYEKLLSDLNYFKNINFDCIIADEASKLKGFGLRTKTTKKGNIRNSFKILADKCEYVFALTATPIENSVANIYNIMQCIDSDVFCGGWRRFKNEFALLDWWGNIKGIKNEDKLKSIINPYIFTHIVDLNINSNVEVVNIDFEEKYKEIYKTLKKSINSNIDKKDNKFVILEKMLKLRQYCNFPSIVYNNIDYTYSPKVIWLLNEINKLNLNEKIIIFTQWVETANRIQEFLKQNNFNVISISGKDNDNEKNEKVKMFEENIQNRILVATDCMSYGMNLQFANNMYIFDLHYNPAKNKQRVGRIVRKGQDKQCNIKLLIMRDSIEERVYHKVNAKVITASEILGYKLNFNLNKNELLQVLRK